MKLAIDQPRFGREEVSLGREGVKVAIEQPSLGRGRVRLGRNRVPQNRQHPRAFDIGQRRRLFGHVLEKRWLLDVCGLVLPRVKLALGHRPAVGQLQSERQLVLRTGVIELSEQHEHPEQ